MHNVEANVNNKYHFGCPCLRDRLKADKCDMLTGAAIRWLFAGLLWRCQGLGRAYRAACVQNPWIALQQLVHLETTELKPLSILCFRQEFTA